MSGSPPQFHIIRSIGEGSYGNIYEVESGEETLALKQVRHSDTGINGILEATILSSIQHPYINNSKKIFSTAGYLNIVQDKGQSDLGSVTLGKRHPLSTIRTWLHQVTQAVYYLHKSNLIHCDIKASNVLYFSESQVRLIDFGLSVKKWEDTQKFKHIAGTLSHCAPEILDNDEWNETVDIWSLGCFFYEVTFGELLIPRQFSPRDSDRKSMRKRYSRSINNWLNGDEFDEPYTPVKTTVRFDSREYRPLKKLILKMMKYHPGSRCNLHEILEDKFFTGMKIEGAKITSILFQPIDKKLEPQISKCMETMIETKTIPNLNIMLRLHRLSMMLYNRINELVKPEDLSRHNIYMVVSAWLSWKIVAGGTPKISTPFPVEMILSYEREVCHYLSYCFPIFD